MQTEKALLHNCGIKDILIGIYIWISFFIVYPQQNRFLAAER